MPGSATELYLYDYVEDNKRGVGLTSTNGGKDWTIADNGFYMPTDMSMTAAWGGTLAVSASEPDLVYPSVITNGKSGDNGWTGLYHSTDGGQTWQNPAVHDGAGFYWWLERRLTRGRQIQ